MFCADSRWERVPAPCTHESCDCRWADRGLGHGVLEGAEEGRRRATRAGRGASPPRGGLAPCPLAGSGQLARGLRGACAVPGHRRGPGAAWGGSEVEEGAGCCRPCSAGRGGAAIGRGRGAAQSSRREDIEVRVFPVGSLLARLGLGGAQEAEAGRMEDLRAAGRWEFTLRFAGGRAWAPGLRARGPFCPMGGEQCPCRHIRDPQTRHAARPSSAPGAQGSVPANSRADKVARI